MNMSDDGKIASIRERQQHRKVNAMIYSEDEELSRYMNPPPAPRLSASKYAMSFGPPRWTNAQNALQRDLITITEIIVVIIY